MDYLHSTLNVITVTGIKIFAVITSMIVTATMHPAPFWIGVVSGFISYVIIRESLIRLKRRSAVNDD